MGLDIVMDSINLIKAHAGNPKNNFMIQDADIEFQQGNDACGDFIKIFLKLDKDRNIKKYGFTGCSSTFVFGGGSLLVDLITGKNIHNVLKLNYSLFENYGIVLENRRHKRQISLPLLSVINGIHEYLKDGIQKDFDDIINYN